MHRLIRFTLSHGLLATTALVGLTVAFAAGPRRDRTEFGYRASVGDDHPPIQRLDPFIEEFGAVAPDRKILASRDMHDRLWRGRLVSGDEMVGSIIVQSSDFHSESDALIIDAILDATRIHLERGFRFHLVGDAVSTVASGRKLFEGSGRIVPLTILMIAAPVVGFAPAADIRPLPRCHRNQIDGMDPVEVIQPAVPYVGRQVAMNAPAPALASPALMASAWQVRSGFGFYKAFAVCGARAADLLLPPSVLGLVALEYEENRPCSA